MIEGHPLKTRDGLALMVMPAGPEHEAELADFFDAVSEEDRRFRFLASGQPVRHDRLAPILDVDHIRSESWLAFEEETGDLVASAMLACNPNFDTGEVAISVRQDRKGMGVGWALLEFLSEEARTWGVRRLISIEDRANHEAIDLEREQGFVAHPVEGDGSLTMLTRLLA